MKTLVASVLLLFITAITAGADLIIVHEEDQVHPGGTNKARVTIMIKGDRVRIDRDFPPVTMITDHNTGKHIGIFHSNKTYRETSLSQHKEAMEGILDSLEAQGKIPAERPRLRATGKKDVINGWKVEEYKTESSTMKATYWIARELLQFHGSMLKAMTDPMTERMGEQFPDPKQFPGMPVMTVLEMESPMGKVKSTIKIISVKELPIADSEFLVPKGYKKQL